MDGSTGPGPLAGLRVVELSHERSQFAGKLLADVGADVVLVEPPGGCPTRAYGPFADDRPDPEGSLWWWHYNTGKRGVVLDLEAADGRDRLRNLLAGADVLLQAEPPGRLRRLGLDDADLRPANPRLLHVAVTAFGRDDPRSAEPMTDLTALAGGGPVWSCGYDDHSLPPVRGLGNQAWHTACHHAVVGLLVALLERERSGLGQVVDVSVHAAANVTTEGATYGWAAAGEEVQRQTGRHASVRPTRETQARCADGRWVNTGVPPRRGQEFAALRDWLADLGLLDDFPERGVLELGAEREMITAADARDDPLAADIVGTGRTAQFFLAAHLTAHDFFVGAQQRGLAAGVVHHPEDLFSDPHLLERGWPAQVDHGDRTFTYPGPPYRFEKTPWAIARRAPRFGEHQVEVLGPLPPAP